MKICITSEGDKLNSMVDPRFGRCKYFIFYDLGKEEYEAVQNPNIEAMGGAGIQSAQLVVEKNAKVVLTGKVGPNAHQTLKTAKIEIISDVSGTVEDAIVKYKEGKFKTSDKQND